jgi:KDO2-lipid IV(A) lauroyltransferase
MSLQWRDESSMRWRRTLNAKSVRHGLEYASVRILSAVLACLPSGPRRSFGRALGRLAFHVDRRHRRVALDNLTMAFPDAEPAWRNRVARGSFEHLGRLLVEILRQKADARRELERTRFEGWEWLARAEGEGRGYFLLSGHFGNWERVAHLQGALEKPLWMVARPLDNPLLENLFRRLRESTGNRVVYKRKAVREIVKGLKEKKGIAFVIDQNFGEAGRIFVPYFGRPAATTPALGSLAARLKVPILPVFSYPEPDGRYRVVYGPILDKPSSEDPDEAAREITAMATARIEEAVRACPEAWFWMHRRWRTRPEGEEEKG